MRGYSRMMVALVGLSVLPPATAQPTDPPKPGAIAPASGDFKSADELLQALESADKDLVSLTAGVRYDRTQQIQGDRQIRMGRLHFVVDPPAAGEDATIPKRRFAIKFDRIYIGPVVRDEDKTYIFDGQWLMEKDGAEKVFLKQQVVAPGERFDPLRIGEGPFVLPIGQRKAEIDKRYVAELLPAADGLRAAADADADAKRDAEQITGAAEGCWQLKLTAKPEFSERENFSEIRLWYKRGANGELLPRMARTVDKSGDISVVLLTDVQLQLAGKPENKAAAVSPALLDTTVPAGWNGKVEPFREHAAGEEIGGARGGPNDGGK